MKLTKSLVVLALSLGLAGTVQARSIDLGTLGNDDFNVSGNIIGKHSSFLDSLSFTLASTSDIADWFMSSGIQSWTVSLTSASMSQSFSGTGNDLLSYGHNTFSSLSAGNYIMTLTGFTGNRRGFYLNAFNVTAVPEADTWVMLMIGAVLVGLRLRRKQQMLPSRSISAG